MNEVDCEKALHLAEHAFRHGHELALHDAVVLCSERKRPLPDWALTELADRSRAFAESRPTRRRRGRHSRGATEQRQLVLDAQCFHKVRECKDRNEPRRRGENCIFKAAEELELEYDTAKKRYDRHRKRIGKSTFYISYLYCKGNLDQFYKAQLELPPVSPSHPNLDLVPASRDSRIQSIVDYLTYNEALFGW